MQYIALQIRQENLDIHQETTLWLISLSLLKICLQDNIMKSQEEITSKSFLGL